jgi:di/tricarboxylate transporter
VPLAELSLAALVVAIIVSCTSSVNVGVLALVFAWIVGVYVGGMRLEQVIAGFPVSLFLTLLGVTLLFAQAQVNGTLDRVAQRAVRRASGSPGVIPMVFFALTAALAAIGPGHIAATALMAPAGMAAAGRYGIPPFLMAVMIANGAGSASLSPIAPTGVIVNAIAPKIGVTNAEWPIFFSNFVAHVAVAFTAYLIMGGWRLLRQRPATPDLAFAADGQVGQNLSYAGLPYQHAVVANAPAPADAVLPFERAHRLTCAVIAALIGSVVLFNVNVGTGALAGAVVLTLARAADEKRAFQAMPWDVIVLVCGVSTLVALLERTGGIDLFAAFLSRLATPSTATAVAAFFSGVISLYSSTSGVVLPALLPTIPGLIEGIGGSTPTALMFSMNVGGHLVDVSPLSTLGALCVAAAPPGTDTRRLFNQLLAWGVSMTVVAAAVSWIFF